MTNRHWIETNPNLDIAFGVYSGADLVALIEDHYQHPEKYGASVEREVGNKGYALPAGSPDSRQGYHPRGSR